MGWVMDVNLTVVRGRLALRPDFELLADGSQRARLLVCVHSERRSRFDVLPVVVPPEIYTDVLTSVSGGARVFVAGHLMRGFSPDPWDPPGRIEIIATAIRFPDLGVTEPLDADVDLGFIDNPS